MESPRPKRPAPVVPVDVADEADGVDGADEMDGVDGADGEDDSEPITESFAVPEPEAEPEGETAGGRVRRARAGRRTECAAPVKPAPEAEDVEDLMFVDGDIEADKPDG